MFRVYVLMLVKLYFLQMVVPNTSAVDLKDSSINTILHNLHRKRNCTDQPLDDRVRMADEIFTGTVRSVEPDSNSPGMQTATVEVKRFFKGEQEGVERVKRTTVVVHGLGDNDRLCHSHVRRRDSWIFLTSNRQGSHTDLQRRLNSSLIRLTLENIEAVDAIVRHYELLKATTRSNRRQSSTQPSQPSTTIQPIIVTVNPCLRTSCRYGARCVSDDGTTTRCECEDTLCDGLVSRGPLCGSDGNEYKDECELKMASCRQQRIITKKYDGPCDSCRGKQCEFHSLCVADNRGGSQCVCPNEKSCHDEQTTKSNVSICGSDGKFYANECEMRVASCQQRQEITTAKAVVCDKCAEVECTQRGQVCVDGECVCRPTPCPAIYDPVCGTDSVTYPNQCKLDEVACTDNRDIETFHKGPCVDEGLGSGDSQMPASADDYVMPSKKSTVESELSRSSRIRCDDSQCSYGAICEAVGAKMTHRCVCRFSCDAVRSAVCGSDGVTYANECQMRETACHKQTSIVIQPIENCEDVYMESEVCDGRQPLINPLTGRQYDCNQELCPAGYYSHRVQPTQCRCCPDDDPVKGCESSEHGCCADGVTAARGPYRAGCPENCQCNSLGAIGQTCDPNSMQCRCKKGVGGRTCDHCETSFWGMHLIRDANSGCIPCDCNVFGSERDDCDQMTGRCVCQPGMRGHKCNICPNGAHVGQQGCNGLDIMQNDGTSVAHQQVPNSSSAALHGCPRQRCSHGSICEVIPGRSSRCKCPNECSSIADEEEQPVCGTDGQTYRRACELKLHACRRRRRIRVAHQGPC